MKDIESIKLNNDENEKLKDKLVQNQKNALYIITKINNIKNGIISIFFKLKKFIDYYTIIIIIVNAYGLYNYLQSLNGCKNSRAYCLHYYTLKQLFNIFLFVLKAGISFSIISVLVYWQLVPISHYILIISVYETIYIFDHEDNFHKHGYYNFYGFTIIVFIVLPLLIYISYIIKFIYQRLYKRLVYILTPVVILIILIYIRYIVLLNCYRYHIGLNGVKINDDPDKYSCFYDYPKKCYIDILSPFMDYSYIAGNCKTIRSLKDQKTYFTYFLIDEKNYENTTRFGFPITTTEEYSLRTQNDIKHFNERVSKNVIDMDKYEKTNEQDRPLKPEVILDFTKDPNGEIKIEINKNKELAKKRQNLGKQYKSKFDNILFIFIDSLSREHFKRKLKKTTKFIENFMKKRKNKEYEAYQFMKYTTFDAFTQMSAQPMFYGEKMDPKTSNGTFILKYMKERGFITGQSINLCSRELFVTMNNCLNRVEFSDFDHENVAMFCDANYYNRDNPYPFLQGGFSIIRRCLYGRDSFEYVLEYGQKFWEAYPDNKKFLRISFIDAHEQSEEVIKYMDEPLTKFLEHLYKLNMLKNTAIFFVSDHGNGMYGFYRDIKADDFLFERTLAFWFMILHGYNDKDGINNLKENAQTLLTPYDIFDTLSDIIFDEVNMDVHTREDLGYSVFRKIDAKNRTCMKYTEWPLDEMCHCRIPGQNYSTPIAYDNYMKNKIKNKSK
jgi:hypothetical protein